MTVRVLVVEDHPDLLEMLGELLELAGALPRLVSSVEAAMAEVEREAPDIIISDVGLEEGDGFELAHRLRDHPDRKSMRVIALTGFSNPEDRARALAGGFDEYVSKPLMADALASLLAGTSRDPA